LRFSSLDRLPAPGDAEQTPFEDMPFPGIRRSVPFLHRQKKRPKSELVRRMGVAVRPFTCRAAAALVSFVRQKVGFRDGYALGIANKLASAAKSPDSRVRIRSRRCPLCDSDEHEVVLRKGAWRLVRCRSCSLAYLPEIPTDDAIDTDYEWAASFDRERADRWRKHPILRVGTMVASRLRPSRETRAMRRILRYAPPGRMLDVGCGSGRLDAMAKEYGYDPTGVEVSPVMAAKARRRLGDDRVLVGRLLDFDLPRGSFDLAITISYLEHEPEPARIVRRVGDLLRSGGIFINKVPNYGTWLRKLLGERWSGYRWPEHVQYFSPRTLSRLLVDSGFEIVRVSANPLSDNFWIVGRRR